ncbi:hypothetical protein [Pseudovibrio axinellae]|nr:hypothetical protein [Pseudovibrio axinellae]
MTLVLLLPHTALAGAPLEPVLSPNLRDEAQLDQYVSQLNEIYPCDWHDAHKRSGYNLYHIGNDIQVLEFSCTVGLHNLASIYIRQVNGTDEAIKPILIHRPKGQPVISPYILYNSFWDFSRNALTSFTVDRGLSDCGSFEVHRFTADGQLKLQEYRAKRTCDGKFQEPTNYQLIYYAED